MGATPLRTQIRDTVLHDLLAGRLSGGDRVGVAPLAERFDVSLTPAREALTQLEAKGWLVLRPNRGFFVSPLTVEEAESIYPVLATLEGLAVELQDEVSPERMEELGSLNSELRSAADAPETALELDRAWHRTLTHPCGNPVLLEQLKSVRKRAERYERAYMRHSGRVPTSADGHQRIAERLEENVREVPGLLREHWDLSLQFVTEWWEASRPLPDLR